LRKPSKRFHPGLSPVSPENWNRDQGRLERREQPFLSVAATARIGRHQRVTTLAQMKQDRAALEDREIPVGQPRNLAEGLVREMVRLAAVKRRALDAIGEPRLFQRPTHAQVAHIAPRHFGNPIEGGEDQIGHSASPGKDDQ
jgi:hypothetical protein